MTPGFKGTVWILLIIALCTFLLPKARAESEAALEVQLEGVTKVFPDRPGVGNCWFNAEGVLVPSSDETKKQSIPCIVGMKLPDMTKHYVILGDQEGPKVLLLYDENTKTQTVLWRAGKEV